MPNIKSSVKDVIRSNKKTLENKVEKSKILTYTKRFKASLASKNLTQAEIDLREVTCILDKAVAHNVIHINAAARKKAHFNKLIETAKNA